MVIIELICGLVNLKVKQRRLHNDMSTREQQRNPRMHNTTLLTPLLRCESVAFGTLRSIFECCCIRVESKNLALIKTIRFECKDITNIFSAQRNTEKSYVIIPLPSFLFIGFNMLTNLILKRKFSAFMQDYKGFQTKLCKLNTFIQKPLVNSEKRSIFAV
jgi:hypothetical protein